MGKLYAVSLSLSMIIITPGTSLTGRRTARVLYSITEKALMWWTRRVPKCGNLPLWTLVDRPRLVSTQTCRRMAPGSCIPRASLPDCGTGGSHTCMRSPPSIWTVPGKGGSQTTPTQTVCRHGRLTAATLHSSAVGGSTRWQRTGIQQVVPVHKLREGSDETKEVREIHLAPPVWSPDGERLAFLVDEVVSRIGGRWVLYIVRTDGTELTRIAEAVVPPVWSPDGEFLTFVRASEIDESGEREEIGEHEKVIGIYTVRADGTDMRQLLAPQSAEWNVTQIALSPDGSELLIVSEQQALIIQADGTGLRSFELPGHPEAWRQVAWSPDGSRIAVFVSSDSTKRGPPQIYTVARDGSDRRDLIRVDDDGNLVPANPPEDE